MFVLHCGADGIATDGVLINNDEQDSNVVVKVVESKIDSSNKIQRYEAGKSNDDVMTVFKSFLDTGELNTSRGRSHHFAVENHFFPSIRHPFLGLILMAIVRRRCLCFKR